jgi:hypothetical protein
LLGAQFLGLGLIAEIIIRTYFEARGKNAYSIRDAVGFDEEMAQLDRAG